MPDKAQYAEINANLEHVKLQNSENPKVFPEYLKKIGTLNDVHQSPGVS